ncbi:hypothetical protein SBA4_2900027 [Candidatus Sulfopaludibacter sp. SbA4]|nr:hypothetical protein SBA4_2900027 [Candidatus Sulfopaludibacter sp. SbA4]
MESIRDIERRIQKAEEQNATVKMPVMERPTAIPEEFEDHAKLMIDLQAIAFQADMTRVVSFMMAREGSNAGGLVHDGARRQQSELPFDRSFRRAPLRDAPHERSGKDREGAQDQHPSRGYVRVHAEEAAIDAIDAGWRRHIARPLADSLRQQHQRR